MSTNLPLSLNIMIISNQETTARKFAEKFSNTQISEADIWHEHREGVDIFSYIRWPHGIITAAPKGVTDILIAYVEEDLDTEGSGWEFIKNYVEERRSIPFKYLVSPNLKNLQKNENFKNFKNFENLFDKTFDEFSNENKEQIIKEAITLEKSLSDVFHKLDLDKDGAIEANEILIVAKSLNHNLSEEDAKEIVNLLSIQGKIYYDKFKQWWIMGRTDFPAFRRLVKWEMFFSNRKYSTIVESKIKEKDIITIDTHKSEFILNIKPTENFEENFAMSGHLVIGDEYKDIIKDSPSYMLTSPLNLGIEMYLRNDNDGPMVLKLLDEIKSKLEEIQIWKFILNHVIKVKFRHVSYSVFIDMNTVGDFSDVLFNFLRHHLRNSQFDLDFHFNSNLSLSNFMDNSTIDEILDKLSLSKFEVKCRYHDIKKIKEMLLSEFSAGQNFAFILKFLLSNHKVNFTSEFEKSSLKLMISEIIMNMWDKTKPSENKLQDMWREVSKEAKRNFKDFREITSVVHSKFYNLLNYILTEQFSMYLNSANLKFFSKLNTNTKFDFLKKMENL
jgi:hypothetical protein